jgi:hypothetical protein
VESDDPGSVPKSHGSGTLILILYNLLKFNPNPPPPPPPNLKSLFLKMKISPGWLKVIIFLKITNAQKNLNKLFLFQRFSLKMYFQYAFDDNLSVTHVFITQIFKAVELAPPFHHPLTGL